MRTAKLLMASAMISGLLGLAACDQNRAQMASGNTGMANMRATLSGAQEVPPVNTGGRGEAQVRLDRNTRLMTWDVNFGGLTGPATAAHFHGPAAPGQNAGVVVPIGQGGVPSPARGSATLTEAQAADLVAGRWYINVHTAAHPAGEIRGQVGSQ